MNDKKDIFILAIETSCDETAAAVVKNGRIVLSNVVSSQIDLHKKYGGVVPEIASRKHVEKINPVIYEALVQAEMTLEDVDAVAVTYGPGLVGALLVGVAAAKAIAFATKKPLIGVHHIEGHIAANYIENHDFKPPFISLIVSGGHTHLVYVKDYGAYEILGKTRDDAAGEAYDKVARAIGIGYPGGPKIDELGLEGDPDSIEFPRAYLEEGSFDFSFSGLKSAVLNYLNRSKMMGESININNVAASFQQAVIEVLVTKTIACAKKMGVNKIALAGGVSANRGLRQLMKKECEKEGVFLQYPSISLCTDNAAMIGSAAYFEYIKGITHDLDLNAVANLKLKNKL
ncbi:MAG TPA: tRNA (adenosine(37)-N6)-threonylcarbamoyltransferase complex transferase subunit TsaD [Defluviitaleaceae bacterium]|jgi:N6-L-threonylcarbamoyladenine synthase|nr:tRNA (adenosine(37)-N6)-threonylcarbamoyltransferase complex transferase subunit TsaD [Candidatus Epulonipiscium sp.]HOA81786.1 tRNA (adenosine(37)-N6)-threonylcarbamoyltransferase complex transferase subunit TsaD [Defluviitaleaceae bacterium]